MVWYHTYFCQYIFLRPIFTTFFTLTVLYKSMGKFSSSKFCISDFRIEINTKFQSGKLFWPTSFFTPNFRETRVRSWTLSYYSINTRTHVQKPTHMPEDFSWITDPLVRHVPVWHTVMIREYPPGSWGWHIPGPLRPERLFLMGKLEMKRHVI